MLSIIVSSCSDSSYCNLEKSIKQTVGIGFEIIQVKNKNGKYNLSKAYNIGASRAKFQYLLFVHEDVIFRTDGWGMKIIKHLDTLENVGVIGVAGSSYKPYTPSGWWVALDSKLYIRIIQGHKYEQKQSVLTENHNGIPNRVVCLDGVFLATRKAVFDEIGFDENIHDFHGYDTDFSLSVAEKYRNYFVPDILVEHLSEGKITDEWIINSFLIHEKWKTKLPMSTSDGKELDMSIEISTYDSYLSLILQSTLPLSRKLELLTKITYRVTKKTRSFRFTQVFLHSFLNRLQRIR